LVVTIRFGPFALDFDTRQLTRDSNAVHLTPKAFELLATLIQERPKALSKAVLQERLWPDTFVAEANLSNLIAEVREALGDDARRPQFLRTVHGFGYAFSASATVSPESHAAVEEQPTCWLEWDRRRFPLPLGEHIIGRDPDAQVRLDQPTVSRRHARLIVTVDGASLEDFDSKNGTFRGTERVTSPIHLVDGDAIRVGSLLVTFHVRSPFGSTDTLHGP
jgi:DNA-binding winged helix-turn-helix (wHTH) protein